MLAPWLAVSVFWICLHSAWATILAYHVLMLLFSRKRMREVTGGWNPRAFMALAVPCLAAGPLTFVLLPSMTRISTASWLSAYGLEGNALLLMIPYYGILHPVLEQAHWGALRRHARFGLAACALFAGYHGLVLSTLMKPLWVAVCVTVLFCTALAWRRVERLTGGLLVPVLTHVIADAGMILAAFLVAR